MGNRREHFSRLLVEVDRMACEGLLPRPILVQRGYTPFWSMSCDSACQLDGVSFDEAVRQARIIICHAGAGTVLTALREGKRPIAMARRPEHGEILDDHQLEFLQRMSDRGFILPVNEPHELKVQVQRALQQTDPANRWETSGNRRLREAIGSILRSVSMAYL